MNTLKEAITYLQLGWSVIPIRHRSKIASRPWKEFQDRRMGTAEAIEAFSGDGNIALVCGDISGVLVIDHDLYKKKVGESDIKVDTPLWATTPRGGKHYYFRYKEGGNTVNHNLAVDIRSKGGYVLLPPSTVDYEGGESGSYTWNIAPSKEILETLPFAPESLLLQLYGTNKPADVSTIFSQPGANFTPFDASSGIGRAEGGRNEFASRFSLSSLNSMKGNVEAAWHLVVTMNNSFRPPLPEQELRATFNSAVKRFQASPPKSLKMSSQPQELVVSPDFKPTSFIEDLEKAQTSFLEGRVKGESSGFPELDEIVGGYIPGQSYLVYADTSVGKSVFALTTLMSLAERGVKSLYFDLENPMELTVERMAFISQKGELNLKAWREMGDKKDKESIVNILSPLGKLNISVWDLNKLTDKYGDIRWEGVKQCIEEEVKNGARFVVIDHLHYFSPSETDHAYLGEVMRQINNLCAQHSLSILVVAHTKKGLAVMDKDGKVKSLRPSMDFISGSGMISRHCKNVVALHRNVGAETVDDRARTIVYVDKTKYGPVGQFEVTFLEQALCFRQQVQDNVSRREAAAYFENYGKEEAEKEEEPPEPPKPQPIIEVSATALEGESPEEKAARIEAIKARNAIAF